MRWILSAAILILTSTAFGQCQWGDVIGSSCLQSTECMRIDPASVIWLESSGCECTAIVRIYGSWRQCDPSAECEEYSFDGQLAVAISGSGDNVGGTSIDGVSTTLAPPPFIYDASFHVPCGGVVRIAMKTSCECVSSAIQPTDGRHMARQSKPVNYVISETEVECQGGARNFDLAAYCDEDCNPEDPGAPVPVEECGTTSQP